MKGGFLGRLGNGILWALSENLQIKRAGLMESNKGGVVVGVLGKGMYLLAASQKTRKINMFEGTGIVAGHVQFPLSSGIFHLACLGLS